MKHTVTVTLLLVMIFIAAQLLGLLIIDKYVDHPATSATGVTTYRDLPYDIERPEVAPSDSYIYIIIAVLIGTGLVFLIMRFGKVSLWKAWFFFSVVFCLSVAFSAFIDQKLALGLAVVLAAVKILKPNILVHNLTEIFLYGGLAAIFVPVMNLFSAFMLLLAISIYDIFAVWMSKHMIAMAKFQASSNLFAGIAFPYKKAKEVKKNIAPRESKLEHTAILGGGDIGFPLMFAGVVMNTLHLGIAVAAIIPLFVSGALLILLLKGEKGKFYPAMPFLSVGCLLGYLVIILL